MEGWFIFAGSWGVAARPPCIWDECNASLMEPGVRHRWLFTYSKAIHIFIFGLGCKFPSLFAAPPSPNDEAYFLIPVL